MLYHIYSKPFHIATGELGGVFFPSWIWMGRQVRKFKPWKYDPYYWLNYHAHPVLSSYYPPHVLTAWISSFLNLDASFKLLVYTMYLHMFVQSLLWYFLLTPFFGSLVSIFGSVLITYAAYQWKQIPSQVYSLTWFPLTLNGDPILSSLGLALCLLSGYYPTLFILLPVALLAQVVWYHNAWFLLGIIPGLIQLIPFFSYLPKTIRQTKSHPIAVGFWEKRWYIGISSIFFVFFSTSRIWPLAVIGLILGIGVFSRFFPRVHQRWFILMAFSLSWMAISGIHNLNISDKFVKIIICLQVLDYWVHNRSMIPTRPFVELWSKPSIAFNTRLTQFLDEDREDYRVSGLPFPLKTGHINRIKTLGYCGGLANKMMAKLRNDTNPNGTGESDWFRSNEDGVKVDTFRIRYAITRKDLNWEGTGIKYCWRNPRAIS